MAAPNGTEGRKVDMSIATSPNNLGALTTLLEEISTGMKALGIEGEPARHELLLKARTLVQALETPRETMIKHNWAQVGRNEYNRFGL